MPLISAGARRNFRDGSGFHRRHTGTVTLVLAFMLMQQVPRQRTPRQQQAPNAQVQTAEAVATFDGTFKSADKKHVIIEVENGQTMQMFVTGATKFLRNGKLVKAADFQSGEPVTVQAERDVRFNLIAVSVEAGGNKDRQPTDDRSAPKRDGP
jgi:hypothetical protein